MRPAFISWKRNMWHVVPLTVVDVVGLLLMINLPVSLRLLDRVVFPAVTVVVWGFRVFMLHKAFELRRQALAEHKRTIGDRETNRSYLDRIHATAARQMQMDRAVAEGLSSAAAAIGATGEPDLYDDIMARRAAVRRRRQTERESSSDDDPIGDRPPRTRFRDTRAWASGDTSASRA
jgi:hypothetical protein